MNFKWVCKGGENPLNESGFRWFLWLSKHPRAFLDKQGLNPKSFKKEKGPGENNITLIFVSCCNSSLCSHRSTPPFAASGTLLGQIFLHRCWSWCEGDGGSWRAAGQQRFPSSAMAGTSSPMGWASCFIFLTASH